MRTAIAMSGVALAWALVSACGPSRDSGLGNLQGNSGASGARPTVFTIVLENHDYDEIVGSSNAPYINSLIAQYGLATSYRDTGHPSLPNYLHMISGDNQYSGSDRNPTTSPFPVDQPNLGTQLEAAGIPWRSYQESMGTSHPCRLSGSGHYAPKHDPFLYFTDMQNGAADLCARTNVDYSAFAADLASNDYRYMWITPNLLDDGHDPFWNPAAGLRQADTWCQQEIPQILASDGFRAGGVLFLTWDEAEGRNGDDGDLTPMIIISPRIKAPGMTSSVAYDHSSYLATVEDLLDLPRLAAVASAPSMLEFLDAPAGPDAGPGPDAAPAPDAGDGQAGGDHLLLTEVRSAGSDEFVEILNPTPATVALDHDYLTDMPAYPRLPAGAPPPVSSDFLVRFPAGASIAPGQVIVVATHGDSFAQSFGRAPDYAITGAAGTAMVPIAVGSSPTITDSGEMIALVSWDGQSDLVADVDVVMVGSSISSSNRLPDKTGLAVDGPDPGTGASSYADDAYTLSAGNGSASGSRSFKRIALEQGHETAGGGNGITGHDETSEDTALTWDQGQDDATPGTVPSALVTGAQ